MNKLLDTAYQGFSLKQIFIVVKKEKDTLFFNDIANLSQDILRVGTRSIVCPRTNGIMYNTITDLF